MPAGIGHRTRDRDKHRTQSYMRREAAFVEETSTTLRATKSGTPRRPVIESGTRTTRTVATRARFGVCPGCGDEAVLPEWAEGECFLCATDGAVLTRAATGGAVREDADGRLQYDELSPEDEERRNDINDLFAEAQSIQHASGRYDFQFGDASIAIIGYRRLQEEERPEDQPKRIWTRAPGGLSGRELHNFYHRRWFWRRKKEGVCAKCGAASAVRGTARCEPCNRYNADIARARQYRAAEQGLCIICCRLPQKNFRPPKSFGRCADCCARRSKKRLTTDKAAQ